MTLVRHSRGAGQSAAARFSSALVEHRFALADASLLVLCSFAYFYYFNILKWFAV